MRSGNVMKATLAVGIALTVQFGMARIQLARIVLLSSTNTPNPRPADENPL